MISSAAREQRETFAGGGGVPVAQLSGDPARLEGLPGRALGLAQGLQLAAERDREVAGHRRQLGAPGERRLVGWRRGRLGGLADPVHEGGHRALVVLAAAVQGEPPVAQPGLHLLEPLGAEELLEQAVPVFRGRPQEGLEPPLRQHRHLGELGEVHARPGR